MVFHIALPGACLANDVSTTLRAWSPVFSLPILLVAAPRQSAANIRHYPGHRHHLEQGYSAELCQSLLLPW